MIDDERRGPRVTRRDAFKIAGLAALGLGGTSDAALATSASRNGWVVKHSNYGEHDLGQSLQGDELKRTSSRFRSLHTLEYLGATWDPYASPMPGEEEEDEEEGSWQHTFRLSGLAATTHATITEEGGEVTSRSFEPRPHIDETAIRIRADEDTREKLAIAPRRDPDLYGFLKPDALRDALAPVTLIPNDEKTLSPEEQFTTAFARNPGDVTSAEHLRERAKAVNAAKERSENWTALLKTVVSLASDLNAAPYIAKGLAKVLEIKDLVSDIETLLTTDVVTMNEGFDYDYDLENRAASTGHFVYFDVHVPRGETANFWVESAFAPDSTRDYVDPAVNDPSVEDTRAWFRPNPRWEVEVSGPESGTDPVEAAEPLPWDEDPDSPPKTNVPVYRSDPDEEDPTARLAESDEDVKPGEWFTVDASGSTTPVRSELRYDVNAYRAFGYGDGPVPVPSSGGDGDGIVRGPTADLTVKSTGDGVFDVALDVPESSLRRFYQVEVVVTDERGMSATATKKVTVPRTRPDVALDAPEITVQGETITLDASGTEGVVDDEDYDWSVELVAVGPYDGTGKRVPYPDDEREDGPISIERPVEWDLSGPTTQHTFGEPLAEKRLVYEVTLTVTSSINPYATDTVKHLITVAPAANRSPTASFTVSGEELAGEVLSLDASDSSDPNGEKDIVAYDWAIERQDGTWQATPSGETTSFELPCTGTDHTYAITLTVADDDEATSTASETLDIPGVDHPEPEVDLVHEPHDPIVDDDEVTFTANVSDYEEPLTYRWTYSDPDHDTLHREEGGATFSRTYHTPGSAFVNVTVTDDCGTNGDDATVNVRPNPEPTVTLDGPSAVTEGDTVTYTADADDDQPIADYTWTVLHPDDSVPNAGGGSEFTYSFDDASDVTISVQVTDQDGATASDNVAVSVNDRPEVSLSGASNVSAYTSHTYEASVSNDRVAAYHWSGPSGTTTTTSSTYTADFGSSDATISVTAEDPQGATGSDSISVAVNEEPTVTLDGPSSVTEGDTATYTASVDDDDDVTYTWTYGQGTLNRKTGGSELTYSFSGSRDFYVSVTVEDDHGATDSASMGVDVYDDNDAPSVSLSYSPSKPAEYETVSFTANASDPDGDSLSYSWSGASISGSSGYETWYSHGTYTVSVTVKDGHGHSARDSVTVNVHDADLEPTQSRSDDSASLLGAAAAVFGTLAPRGRGDDEEVDR